MEEAVLREANEETGLENLKIHCYLGETEFDNSVWGLNSIHLRKFFHLTYDGPSLQEWVRKEKDSSIRTSETPERITFDLKWSPFDEIPQLQLGHEVFLDQVLSDH